MLRPAILLALLVPLASAQALPVDVALDPEAGSGRAVVAWEPPPRAVPLPGPQGNETPLRLDAHASWRAEWAPASCDAPALWVALRAGATAEEARAPILPSRCDLALPVALEPPAWSAPDVPPAPSLPRWPAELARASPLAFDASVVRFAASQARHEDVASAGAARVAAVPAEGQARAEAAVDLVTPALEARASASTDPEEDTPLHARSTAAEGMSAPRVAPASPARLDRPSSPATRLALASPAGDRDDAREAGARPRGIEAPAPRLAPIDAPRGPDAPRILPLVAGAVALALAFLLYQRFGRHRALDHPTRRALHEACADLGRLATAGELGARVGVARKTAEYHLAYMARLGLLRELRDADGPRRFGLHVAAPAGDGAPLEARIMEALRARPGLSASELVALVGGSRARIERLAKGLALAGVVETRRVRGARRFYLA